MLNPSKNLSQFLSQLTSHQKSFLRNAAIAFVLWFVVADIDWIHNLLVKSLAVYAADIIALISGVEPTTFSSTEGITGYCIWNVADARGRILIGSNCDGWEIYYLCAAFILGFPGKNWKRKISFTLIGILTLYITNVFQNRCSYTIFTIVS